MEREKRLTLWRRFFDLCLGMFAVLTMLYAYIAEPFLFLASILGLVGSCLMGVHVARELKVVEKLPPAKTK